MYHARHTLQVPQGRCASRRGSATSGTWLPYGTPLMRTWLKHTVVKPFACRRRNGGVEGILSWQRLLRGYMEKRENSAGAGASWAVAAESCTQRDRIVLPARRRTPWYGGPPAPNYHVRWRQSLILRLGAAGLRAFIIVMDGPVIGQRCLYSGAVEFLHRCALTRARS